jgi:hypothetical protein
MARECCAIEGIATLVKRNDGRFVRNQSRNRGGFFGDSRRGIARTAFRNVMKLNCAKTDFAADVVEAFAVAIRKLAFRTLLEFADGNNDDTHELSCAGLTRASI